MSVSLLPSLINPTISTFKLSSLLPPPALSLLSTTHSLTFYSSSYQTLKFPSKRPHSLPSQNDAVSLSDTQDLALGDCLVFEEGAFENPHVRNTFFDQSPNSTKPLSNQKRKKKTKKPSNDVSPENLVPEKWRLVQEELNLTKKEKRKIAQEIEFGSRVEKRRLGYKPLKSIDLQEYLAYKKAKFAELNPIKLDNPTTFRVDNVEAEELTESSERVAPRNPKWAVYGRGLEDLSNFFNSEKYVAPDKKTDGPRKLFSKEEKVLLNKKIPDLETATSRKWLPLHTLAASGEFYIVASLLKHNVDINAVDKNGLTALHKAIIGKKQAVMNCLLRESANPFVCDEDGATLLHYAVQTASSPAVKILLLYNVDINLQDNDGWTPLHLAVQARRTDIVKLLLIKGADKELKNRDGLTPLDLCLYSGQDTKTYEMIKILKLFPKPR